MYQPMRRKKNELTEEQALDILDRAQWGVLSLSDGDGLPYGVPLNHTRVGRKLVFHCALEGQKLDFLRANPKGWFTAVASAEVLRDRGSTRYESAMAAGPLRIVEGDEARLAAFDAINAKYTAGFDLGRSFVEKWGKAALVLEMDIELLTAKGNLEE